MYESSITVSIERNTKQVQGKLTNEVTILVLSNTCLLHSFVEHLGLRLTDESVGAVIAVRHALEEIVNLQQLNHTLAVGDVGIREKP